VLPEGVQVEIGVLGRAVVLAVPVVGEDATVHVPQESPAPRTDLNRVVQLVEPAVLALGADDEPVRRIPDHHPAPPPPPPPRPPRAPPRPPGARSPSATASPRCRW